jgi:hypothetical protein
MENIYMLDFLSSVKPESVVTPPQGLHLGGCGTRAPAPRYMTGRALARQVKRFSRARRAFLAADILAGQIELGALTVGQVAMLAGTNRTYILYAQHATPAERHRIEAGKLSLSGSTRPRPSLVPALPAPACSLPIAWNTADPVTRAEFIRTFADQIFAAI